MRGFPVEVSAEAAAAHARATVVDLHNDALTKLTHSRYDFTRRHAPATFYNPLRMDLDLPRIRAGGIHALGCLMFAGFRVARQRRFWRQLDCARRLVAESPDALALARTPVDIAAARASGRVALFLGVEGSYALDDLPDVDAGVARLVEGGVRFVGPLWERDSACGTSCRTDGKRDTGLTDRGRALVRACNDAGILL
ncbi:MAG TPA: membrane dipeptidase, partial [Polyangia bacterium]|nr:membrane dipeptidase [Polyangia bacterium]